MQQHAVAAGGVGQDRHAAGRDLAARDVERLAKDVDQRVAVRRGSGCEKSRAGRQRDVEIERLGVRALHGAGDAVALAGDDAHLHAGRRA